MLLHFINKILFYAFSTLECQNTRRKCLDSILFYVENATLFKRKVSPNSF